jgi:hypothetical protein
MLSANPRMKANAIVDALKAKGISVQPGLVYYIKGKVRGRKGRKKRAQGMVAKVAVTTGSADALATILKIKHLATELGGLKKLKAIVDALSE